MRPRNTRSSLLGPLSSCAAATGLETSACHRPLTPSGLASRAWLATPVIATLIESSRSPKRVWRILLQLVYHFRPPTHAVRCTPVTSFPAPSCDIVRLPCSAQPIPNTVPYSCFKPALNGHLHNSSSTPGVRFLAWHTARTGSSGNRNQMVRVSHLDNSRLSGSCRCRTSFPAATVHLSRSHVATLAEQPESPNR